MEITLASANKKKLNELNDILSSTELSVFPISKADEIEVIEDQDTFIGNAKLKALAYAKHLNKVVLSDDSGICIEVLNGMPGIYSARYSGMGDHENNIKLLDALKNHTNRRAYFVCALALAFPDGKVFTYEAKWHGTIAQSLTGDGGFGYDPLFIPLNMNQSVASLDNEYKKKHSHRYQAIMKLLEGKDEIINYWRYSWKK